jgi:hypothetical protein
MRAFIAGPPNADLSEVEAGPPPVEYWSDPTFGLLVC